MSAELSRTKGANASQRPVGEKPTVRRMAMARGELHLSARGRSALLRTTEKGDALPTAVTAGMLAMKRTAELIPHCHVVPLTASSVRIFPIRSGVRAVARAEAVSTTGVEMEALVGVTVALLTVWDMVKSVEKDPKGEYPLTALHDVRVVRKVKSPI